MAKANFFTTNVPPRIDEVKIYFNQRGIMEMEAEHFFLFYNAKNWKSQKGNYLKNWKTPAYRWIMGIIQHQPQLFNRHIH